MRGAYWVEEVVCLNDICMSGYVVGDDLRCPVSHPALLARCLIALTTLVLLPVFPCRPYLHFYSDRLHLSLGAA